MWLVNGYYASLAGRLQRLSHTLEPRRQETWPIH